MNETLKTLVFVAVAAIVVVLAWVAAPSPVEPEFFSDEGESFWQPVPDAGWHDIFALMKRKEARVEGDLRPFMANLQYIKDLLAAPRRVFEES